MANLEECEQALHDLAARLAAKPASQRTSGFDRRLSATIRDIGVVFAGRLHDGLLDDIQQAATADGQIRLIMNSDDLLSLVDGSLHMAGAWASGRVKVKASVRDMMRLRSIF